MVATVWGNEQSDQNRLRRASQDFLRSSWNVAFDGDFLVGRNAHKQGFLNALQILREKREEIGVCDLERATRVNADVAIALGCDHGLIGKADMLGAGDDHEEGAAPHPAERRLALLLRDARLLVGLRTR